jgi:hypothetical protein
MEMAKRIERGAFPELGVVEVYAGIEVVVAQPRGKGEVRETGLDLSVG